MERASPYCVSVCSLGKTLARSISDGTLRQHGGSDSHRHRVAAVSSQLCTFYGAYFSSELCTNSCFMPPILPGVKTSGQMLCHEVIHVFCDFRQEPHPTSDPLFSTAWSCFCGESNQIEPLVVGPNCTQTL